MAPRMSGRLRMKLIHHFHVVPALLQVPQIVDDQTVIAAQTLNLPAQPQVPLGRQEASNQARR